MRAVANGAEKLNKSSTRSIYGDYLLMLTVPCFTAYWYYGVRSLLVVAASVASAVITDMLAGIVINKKINTGDPGSIFTGAAIAMMMPSGIPYYVPVFASVFAVAVVKVPFGGSLKAPFVPAAAGFAFASVCFSDKVFDYTAGLRGSLFGATSLGSMLMSGRAVYIGESSVYDIVGGNVAGPMGTGCALLMVACAFYLLIRRPKALVSSVSFIAVCVLMVALFPRVTASFRTNLVSELCSGSLLFAAVFFVTDPVTQPEKIINKIIYGAVCGAICMAMRLLGAYEEPVCFAVLLANAFRPILDSAINNIPQFGKKASRKEVRAE